MQRRLKTYLGYILAIVFLILTVLLYLRTENLEEKFEKSSGNSSTDTILNTDLKLKTIDSFLKLGNYKEASAYIKSISDEQNFQPDDEYQLKSKLIREILTLRKSNKAFAEKETTSKQSYDSVMEIKSDEIDSLKLALVNAEVDKYYLEEKIEKITAEKSRKSFGEYLTFKTTKGKSLHYIGEVKNGLANGYGIAILETGSRYVGEWKDNMRHGNGEFYWDDGESYKGNYVNDLREGYGVYIFETGEKYVGQWKKDMRDGVGKFYGEDGKLLAEGVWEKDELIDN
jgi:hypothetical protein